MPENRNNFSAEIVIESNRVIFRNNPAPVLVLRCRPRFRAYAQSTRVVFFYLSGNRLSSVPTYDLTRRLSAVGLCFVPSVWNPARYVVNRGVRIFEIPVCRSLTRFAVSRLQICSPRCKEHNFTGWRKTSHCEFKRCHRLRFAIILSAVTLPATDRFSKFFSSRYSALKSVMVVVKNLTKP